MATEIIPVPDLGGAEQVQVIEVCVQRGEHVDEEQSLIVLESDKASMEVPCPRAGRVVSLSVKEGDSVGVGDAILELEPDSGSATADPADADQNPASAAPEEPSAQAKEPSAQAKEPSARVKEPSAQEANPAADTGAGEQVVRVPDLGGAESVAVIELCVNVGDSVGEGDSLIVLESDKASMEVPAPAGGKVLEMRIEEGARVSEGDPILLLRPISGASPTAQPASAEESTSQMPEKPVAGKPVAGIPVAGKPVAGEPSPAAEAADAPDSAREAPGQTANKQAEHYAGPAVRRLARQMGAELGKVIATGPRGRITKDDVRAYVRKIVAQVSGSSGKAIAGAGIPAVPDIDFSQFGEVEVEKLSRIASLTAANMSRAWLNVPHVTQFDEADITDLEAFRKSLKPQADRRGVKLTPLPFLMKAAAAALLEEPRFNVSLHANGEQIVRKKYVHIGIAVDTPNGLMVPVIRDVDRKGIWQLAEESLEMASLARNGKLKPRDMQGACFTISSLGALGGMGFTPIVNTPEVAILGVSRAQMKPVWDGERFEPRKMLPLSVSYDHRAINGADCGRFFTYLVSVLSDIRHLTL